MPPYTHNHGSQPSKLHCRQESLAEELQIDWGQKLSKRKCKKCQLSSPTTGTVFYKTGSLSYDQADQACKKEGAELALVGHLYSAWRFLNYDRCDGGWLRDGSVRYPIAFPRPRCGGFPEPGIRSFGFPTKTSRLYGAYCYRLAVAWEVSPTPRRYGVVPDCWERRHISTKVFLFSRNDFTSQSRVVLTRTNTTFGMTQVAFDKWVIMSKWRISFGTHYYDTLLLMIVGVFMLPT